MGKYNTYHSGVKICYSLGLQNELLSDKFIKEIPNSTSHSWKKDSSNKFIGAEFASGIQDNLYDTRIFLDRRLAVSRKAFIQFGKLYLTIITLIGKENFKKLIKSNRNVFVDLIENLGDDFPVSKKVLLRFLTISKSQYVFWLSDRKFACSRSLIGQ